MFKMHNANPKGRKTSDCVIRAICFAIDKSWEEVLTGLYELAMEYKAVPNSSHIFPKYLESSGFTKCKVQIKDHHRPTVKSFTEEHPTGTYILSIANHVVCVKDGYYWDTWDCGNKSVYTYWVKR